MRDSEAANEHQITSKLFRLASAAIAKARQRPITDRLLDDEDFLERLADKVAERVCARQEAASSRACSGPGEAAKAFAGIAFHAR